jgi:hypothetical protein
LQQTIEPTKRGESYTISNQIEKTRALKMKWLIWAFVAATITLALAEVLIPMETVPTIYDETIKLPIIGTGFDADEEDIMLEISGQGDEKLERGDHFIVRKFSGGVVLHLRLYVATLVESILLSTSLTHEIFNTSLNKQTSDNSYKWTIIEEGDQPVPITLTSVKFVANPAEDMLQEPVIIANVLMQPKVIANSDIISATSTKELRINVTGLIGIRKVTLKFSPPLYNNISYYLVSPFPLEEDQLVLRLRDSQQWRQDTGPLRLLSIDTGGGMAKASTSDEDGVIVAQVNADVGTNSVTVRSTAAKQLIYHDEPRIKIWGTGFSSNGNSLRFSNGILGRSINYTITGVSNTLITLRLIAPSVWYKNMEELPRLLTVLSINAGEGFLPQGLENNPRGCPVATVFELPHVNRLGNKVYRTKDREITVYGRGFTTGVGTTRLKFFLPFSQGKDYDLEVISRTELKLTLLEGKQWRPNKGPLHVLAINTRGDEAGWIRIGGHFGTVVSQIVDDEV